LDDKDEQGCATNAERRKQYVNLVYIQEYKSGITLSTATLRI